MKWPLSNTLDSLDSKCTNCNPRSGQTIFKNNNGGSSPDWIKVLLPCAAVGTVVFVVTHVYRNYVRRIPTSSHIQPHFLRRRSVFGRVTSVGDGDNLRVFHTPGGMLTGWGWLPGRMIPVTRKDLKDQTVHIRIAGVDAPEGAHFGRTPQPYSAEALEWLKNYVCGRNVRAYVHSKDQYDRVVANVKVRKGFFRKDVGLEMLKAGMATVYEAKTGAEFGNLRAEYELAEAEAKKKRIGLWSQSKRRLVSPHTYKKALRLNGE